MAYTSKRLKELDKDMRDLYLSREQVGAVIESSGLLVSNTAPLQHHHARVLEGVNSFKSASIGALHF